MKQVLKYALGFSDKVSILLPVNAKILKIDEQNNSLENVRLLYIWALVDSNETHRELRTFYIYGTGHTIDDDLELEYINTIFTMNDSGIWHIFENKKV